MTPDLDGTIPTLPEHHANALPVREVALAVFDAIALKHDTLDRAFGDNVAFAKLNGLDRALVRMIVTTTIRRLGQIDDLIAQAMNGAPAPTPELLRSLLRVSVAQTVFMKIPDHAAVNLSVNLTERIGLARQKGLVNAVLRRIARDGKTWTTRQDIPRLNIPKWMLENWIDAYGRRRALDAAQGSLTEAPLDISVKDPTQIDHWAAQLDAIVLPTGTLRLKISGGTIESLPGYSDGAWWVQDAAAALPVTFLGDVAGKTVIDLCAAPGGKTAQLAARGAQVIAVDRNDQRLAVLTRNLERLGLKNQVEPIVADGAVYMPRDPVDAVLIDAPCTATGTLRRNPDITLHRRPEDVGRMAAVQDKLLNRATKMVKPGGLLVYAVCSLQSEEGEDQIARFLSRHPDFDIAPLTPDDVGGEASYLTKDGFLRLLPGGTDRSRVMDGFFTARLRRLAE